MFEEYKKHGVGVIIYQIICVTLGVLFLSKYLEAILMNELIN